MKFTSKNRCTWFDNSRNEPIKVESGILNVEIATCSSHEDSRKPSDALIQIQQKIPNIFDNAVYKECYQKNFNSFASFEIPIAVGKLDDSSEIKHNVNIYSYKNHYLNVQTSDKLAKNIRDFMDREYLSDLALSLTLKINNDTNQALDVTFISAYVNDSPVDFLPLTFKQGESIEVKLSNASSDMLWQYEASPSVSVMTKGFELDDILK